MSYQERERASIEQVREKEEHIARLQARLQEEERNGEKLREEMRAGREERRSAQERVEGERRRQEERQRQWEQGRARQEERRYAPSLPSRSVPLIRLKAQQSDAVRYDIDLHLSE